MVAPGGDAGHDEQGVRRRRGSGAKGVWGGGAAGGRCECYAADSGDAYVVYGVCCGGEGESLPGNISMYSCLQLPFFGDVKRKSARSNWGPDLCVHFLGRRSHQGIEEEALANDRQTS